MSIGEIIERSYEAHAAAIRARAQQLTRDPEVAADVTQEAYMRLLVEMQADRTPDNISAWLYRTSTNLIVSRARHAVVARRALPSLVRGLEPAGPDAIAVIHEAQGEVSALLANLSVPERTALLMAAHGASGREIARSIGRSHVATRALLSRARGRLRRAEGRGRTLVAAPSVARAGGTRLMAAAAHR